MSARAIPPAARSVIVGKSSGARYASEFPDTVLGFSGTTEMNGEDDYVRVHGPSRGCSERRRTRRPS